MQYHQKHAYYTEASLRFAKIKRGERFSLVTKSLFVIHFKCWYMSSFHDVYLVFNKNDVWWCLLNRVHASWKEAPVSECTYYSGKASYVLFFYIKQNFLQIFEIYDVSNNWNVKGMSVKIRGSKYFKATTKLLIHILYFFFALI